VDYKSFNQFFSIYIGFFIKRKYFSHINLDRHLANNPFCCSNLRNLPFESETCQMINIKHFFKYFPKKNYSKLIKSWRKKLIPGGIIKIQFKLKNNEKKFENLNKSIKQNLFYVRNVDRTDLKINENITIIAIKKKRMKPTLISVSSKKFNDLLLILKQNKDIISNKNNLCILGYDSNIIKQFLKKMDVNVSEIHLFVYPYSIS